MTQVVLVETHGKVGLIRINRPEAMNALNNDVVDGIGAAVDAFEADENIGCIVITGNEKAFAAGADIGFMKDFDYMHAYKTDFITRNWERIKTTPQAGDRRGGRLCAGRRLRAGDDVRHDLSPPTPPSSASRKSSSAPCPAPAARSACRAPSARPRRWTCA
jgi:hypothetical protein